MPGESLDSRKFVGQISGDFSPKPVCEFSGKANRFGRAHTVAGEWFSDVYLVRLNSQQVREPGDQPLFDDFSAVSIQRRAFGSHQWLRQIAASEILAHSQLLKAWRVSRSEI